MISKLWNKYINKQVKLIIEDTPFPRKRDGLLVDIDQTHIWLQTEYKEEPIPFSRTSVKRIDLNKEQKENGKTKR